MATLFHKQTTKILIDGFIRKMQTYLNPMIIPNQINDICFNFYHIVWLFQETHPYECFKISEDRLTIDTLDWGTILFGEFIKYGFFAMECKVFDVGNTGPCIIDKQFKKWKEWEDSDHWYHVCMTGRKYGLLHKDKGHIISISDDFVIRQGDVIGIMIDMDNHIAEFKNITKKQHIQFKVIYDICSIAFYCNGAKWTVTKEISNRDKY
eukprot:443082_1